MSENQQEKKTMNANRTSGTLRDVLFDEIDALKSGESNHQRAGAVAKLAQQILNTAKTEMEFWKLREKLTGGDVPDTLGTMALGQVAQSAASAPEIATGRSCGIAADGSAE